jgi:hypothetical protein
MRYSYSYQAEKFSSARRALMLPHTSGEHQSVADAFHECHLGLHKIERADLDDNARSWIEALEVFMDTSGLSDPSDQGLWAVKARSLSTDEKLEISRLVDELAHWFDSRDM